MNQAIAAELNAVVSPDPPPLDLPAPPVPAHVSRSGRVRKPRFQHLQDYLPTSYAGPSTPHLHARKAAASAPTEPTASSSLAPLTFAEEPQGLLSPLVADCTPPASTQTSPSCEVSRSQTLPTQNVYTIQEEQERETFPLTPRSYEPSPSGVPSTEYKSSVDAFGMYRVFPVRPKRDPDKEDQSLEAFCDPVVFPTSADFEATIAGSRSKNCALSCPEPRPPYAPFPNVSTFDVLYWQNNGSTTKSDQQMNALAQAMQEPGFDPTDLAHFNAAPGDGVAGQLHGGGGTLAILSEGRLAEKQC